MNSKDNLLIFFSDFTLMYLYIFFRLFTFRYSKIYLIIFSFSKTTIKTCFFLVLHYLGQRTIPYFSFQIISSNEELLVARFLRFDFTAFNIYQICIGLGIGIVGDLGSRSFGAVNGILNKRIIRNLLKIVLWNAKFETKTFSSDRLCSG